MKKDFFNFLKVKQKKYAKLILCYSLASIVAFTQSFPVLAASSNEKENSMMKDTISSNIEDSSKDATEENKKDTITSEDTSTKSKARTTDNKDSKDDSDNSKDSKDSKDDSDNSKDSKDSKEDSDTSTDSKDSKDDSDSSKDSKDSKDDSDSSKDSKDSKDDSDSSKDNKDSKDDSSKDNKDSKDDSDSSKDSKDSKDDSDSSKDSKDSKDDSDSSKDNKDSKDDSDSSKDSKDSKDDSDSSEDSSSKTTSMESSSSTTAATKTESYETVEDIEIATEDPVEYDDNELLVQFKTEVSENKVKEIAKQLPETTLESYSDGIAVFCATSKTVIEEDIAILSTMEEIAIIQPNYKYSFSSADEGEEIDEMEEPTTTSPIPNDTFFSKQWGLYNNGTVVPDKSQSSPSSSGIDINVLDAWKTFQSSNEVIVAVIDTGVDYQHKDLKDHMWYNKSELEGTTGVDDDNNGYTDDIYGWDFYNDDATVCHYSGTSASKKDNDNHGTRCAGIIAATVNNNFGIAGVASNVDVKIMSLKTAGGSSAEGDTANIIKAIKYASYNGAKICNASWNCDKDDPALKLAIAESNMLFICSAGNGYGTNIDNEPSYPCSYNLSNIVGVTSIDSDGTLSYFSNYGSKSVSMAAPGSNICSTIVGKYRYDSGTSMAAPFVTGVAAMLYAYDSTLYPARAKNILLSATKSLSALRDKVATNGMIDAAAAVSIVQGKTYKKDTIPPTITPKVIPKKDGAYLSVSVKDSGGSCTRVRRYAYGKQSASYFKNGENGKSLSAGSKPYVTKEGYYTIYAQDNAGNEAVKVINVSFDKKAPSLSLSYKKSGTKYKITIQASDSESGISEVRYAKSKHTASYLKSNGTKLGSFVGSKTITASSESIYSFYAKDKAGNTVTKTITIDETAPSLSLFYKKSGKKYIITVKASDSISGLSEVRYTKSRHTVSYLKSKGTKLSSFSRSKSITVSSKGIYSFYARDKSGNTVVKTITLK